jgi:hypothetical protein
VAETMVKSLLCCGFRRTGKVMGQVYKCWWRICREINVFSSFEYHEFYVLCPFVSYLLTLPHTWLRKVYYMVASSNEQEYGRNQLFSE